MAKDESIFRYKRFGLRLTVYGNRVEIVDRGGLHFWFPHRESILIRNIATVEVKGMARRLIIQTNDGRSKSFNLGGKAEKVRQAILSIL